MLNASAEEGALRDARDWLTERHRAGNWYDITPTDEIPACVVPGFRAILHMFQIFFGPEIRKRLDEGQIDDSFELRSAQMVRWGDRPPEARLNDEVRGVAMVRANRDVSQGDPVYLQDLDGVEGFDLGSDERDAGHFTLFCGTNGHWMGFFDFRMWRREVSELLDVAAEFLAAAKFSHGKRHARPTVDTLFTTCELMAKARLMLAQYPGIRSSERHGATHSALNSWSHQGNVDERFTQLFNRLTRVRKHAKYGTGIDITMPSHEEISLAETELQSLARSVSQRPRRGAYGHKSRQQGTLQ